MKKLLLLFLFLASPVYADFRHFNDWSKEEKALYLTNATLSYIDTKQTIYALEHKCGCYAEGNSFIYGSDPHPDKVILINLATNGLIYFAIGNSKQLSRFEKNAFWVVNAIRFSVVQHNSSIGISWRVAF